ncbi:hypothetical protein EUTSA_v10013415mg [Eutrema salsugineum]|uniref:DUF668 domain-containing protein n=1 Tax=Eutrema salsugineum TaxID=72664 RepID=V4NBS5_EUTSA|nr:uncharacterized protein LOC18018897 [Eutrema salsugineum]ESQ43381.1 hypothetical protein EUTSA_v10013415mg [Eutrema salsugineum]
MALETFLIKLKNAISSKPTSRRQIRPSPPITTTTTSSSVGVLSFEVARVMTKLLHLTHSLTDSNLITLRDHSLSLEGLTKIVNGDETFYLSLVCAELADTLAHTADSVSRLSRRCTTPSLRSFHRLFHEFADMGRDPHGWVMSCKDTEAKNKKVERYVSVTTALYREMEEMTILENSLRKHSLQIGIECEEEEDDIDNKKDAMKVIDLQQKIERQRQHVKYLKDRSLWTKSFDTVVLILARSVFTALARLKSVFSSAAAASGCHVVGPTVVSFLPRSLSSSSSSMNLVHPSPNDEEKDKTASSSAFLEESSRLLKPPETTLGGSGVALHYANLIVVMEKMIKQPQLVGLDARDDLYSMLPASVRSSLRSRLKGVGFTATDGGLAAEWKAALGRILRWLLPLAQNMIRWQSERSFEQQHMATSVNSQNRVMLVQTLVFADKVKTEAAITELLVGLNYIWRFEREMTAKALFNLQSPLPNHS